MVTRNYEVGQGKLGYECSQKSLEKVGQTQSVLHDLDRSLNRWTIDDPFSFRIVLDIASDPCKLQINKMWYMHTKEYYLAIKRNEVLMHGTIWINLEYIILSERSQSQMDW